MSIVRHQPIKKNTPPSVAAQVSVAYRPRRLGRIQWIPLLCIIFVFSTTVTLASESNAANQESLLTTVTEYALAVGKNDRVAAGQRDFVCLLKMATQQLLIDGNFPDALSPVYEWCAKRRTDAHGRVLNQHDGGLDNIWPGQGN